MKRVLIITYYWPPSGGAGVQRWLKFSKFLREFGYEPVIYTAEGGEVPVIDYSLLQDVPAGIEVIKRPIWEPYSFYKKFIGQKSEEKINAGFLSESKKPKFAEKIAVWLRGNFFIPDARRFWIRPSIKYLSAYLKKHPVEAIISTGPPHSMHLIALGLKKNKSLSSNLKPGIPWIADFRDPWTNIDFYHHLMLTRFADAKHKRLEKEVLKYADRVVIVSRSWAEDLKKVLDRRVDVITNGFDEEDFKTINNGELRIENDAEFRILHVGSINKDRNPLMFWKALKELVDEREDFRNELKVQLIGKNDVSVIESIKENGLNRFIETISYVPHAEIAGHLSSAHILLLPLNNTPNVSGVIPGKLFEYLAARKMIMGIGYERGDSAKIIEETQSGVVCDFEAKDKIKREIVLLYEKHKRGEAMIPKGNISKYSRRSCCGQYAQLLNEIA